MNLIHIASASGIDVVATAFKHRTSRPIKGRTKLLRESPIYAQNLPRKESIQKPKHDKPSISQTRPKERQPTPYA